MRSKQGFICLLLLSGGAISRIPARAQTGQDAAPKQDSAAKPGQADPLKGAGAKLAVDPEKDKSIRKLLEVTGSAKVGVQVVQQMIASMRQSQPSIPEEFWTEFAKKVKPEGLVDMVIPIYAKYYSQEDLDGLLAFYQTPLGQKVIATLPVISKESVQAGEQWGRAIGEQVTQELQKRYAQSGSMAASETKKPDGKKSAAKTTTKSKPKQ